MVKFWFWISKFQIKKKQIRNSETKVEIQGKKSSQNCTVMLQNLEEKPNFQVPSWNSKNKVKISWLNFKNFVSKVEIQQIYFYNTVGVFCLRA